MTSVAVIVPGIMGSVLKLDGEVIWPGPLTTLMLPFRRMPELLSDDLVATDCIRKYFITTQYQGLIDNLEILGFGEANGTLLVAAYDWRKDNALAAEVLAKHIDEAVARHGAATEISIFAHSMGGLVSRYYLESGKFNGRSGFANVRRLLAMATPHRGAPLALPLLLGLERRLFLSAAQVQQIANDPRYPAAYQLLPPPGEPFAWDDSGKDLQPSDVYSQQIAGQLGLLKTGLDAARDFQKGLDVTKRPGHVRYFCFAGTRQTTTTHVLIRPAGQNRLQAAKVEREDGGDGTVATWGAFLPGFQSLFVGGEHGTIYQDDVLTRELASVLGQPGVLAGIPAVVDVTVRRKVVEPGADVHVTIDFGHPVSGFSGVLTVDPVTIDPNTGAATNIGNPISQHDVSYTGAGMQKMTVILTAPTRDGVFRVGLRDDLQKAPSDFDELIVQQKSP
jgi:phospholipase A1